MICSFESVIMAKSKKDPLREARIENEIVVDAYGPQEQAMGWYCYLESNLSFPFRARCIKSNVLSPLQKGEIVEACRMAAEDVCSSDMLVLVRWQGHSMALPLSQLAALEADETTGLAIGDWHYWVARGYRF
jgi:hypothetical protein